MATYIPGITDYIPQIQPFKPDYNFYGNILQTKQGQFDAGHKQLSSVYSTLLNSPMSRDQNLARRDAFFKGIDQDIKKMSGMDLSLEENVNAANKVFTSFYNDKHMVNDMVKTKKWMNELDRGNNFRNCVDPVKCGGQFWEAGLQALQYKHDDFRKASDEQALQMDMGRYVPYQNFTDEAFKAAKDMGFAIKTDTVHGGYIVTTKNGQQLTPQLNDFFMAKFGDDPKMMDVFKTQAYVQRKGYINSRAALLGDESLAENEYINTVINTIPQQQKAAQKAANDTHESVSNQLKVAESLIKEKGVSPNDEVAKAFADLQEQYGITTANKAVQDKATSTVETASNIKDPLLYKDRIDDIVAYAMLQRHSKVTAENYAMKDTGVDIKADPYGLATHQSNLSLRNSMQEKAADFDYWTKKESIKQSYDEKKRLADEEKMKRMLGLDEKPIYDPNTPGAATDQTRNTLIENAGARNELYGQHNIDQRSFLKDMAGSMKAAYDAAGQSDVPNGAAKQKLILETAQNVFKNTGVDPGKLFNDETYAGEFNKVSSLDMSSARSSYEKAMTSVNPNAKGVGALNSFWSQSFWNDKAPMTEKIKVREKLIQAFDKQYLTNSIETKSQAMGEYIAKGDVTSANMVESLTDKAGRKLSREEFAKNYATKNAQRYQADQAPNLGMQSASTYSGANLTQSEPKSGFQKAYIDAFNNFDKIDESYSTKYQTTAKAYNGLAMLGGRGGADATAGYWYKFDPAAQDHNGTTNGYSIFRNYDQLKAGDNVNLNVKFGDAATVGNNEDAKRILDVLEADSKKFYKPTEDKRPVVSYRAQNIAGGDPNMMAVHFKIPETWLAQYTKKNGVLADIDKEEALKGITLFIPKDKATNQYYQDNQKDDYDRILDLDGQITVDAYPDAGKMSIKKVGNKYIASGHYNDVTTDNKIVPTPYYKEFPEQIGLKPGMIVDGLNNDLKQYSLELQNFKTTYNAKNGIKDPSQLLSQ